MPKVLLRDFRESDFEDVVEMNADARLKEFIGGPMTREESRTGFDILIKNADSEWAPKAICLEGNPKVIGYCGLQPLGRKDKSRIEIFYGLHSAFWGHGYASQAVKLRLAEAFASDLETIYASVDGKNKRSLALVVKLGFAIEGERFNEELQKNEILFSLQKP